MTEVVSRSTSRERFNMLLMTVFGGSALLLATIGIYGLMAYSVQQRTQEIGIRLALGAVTSDVRNMVVFQGMRLALVGVLIGIAASFGLARVIASFLYGVRAHDPGVFVSIPVLLSLVALFAVWLPARRESCRSRHGARYRDYVRTRKVHQNRRGRDIPAAPHNLNISLASLCRHGASSGEVDAAAHPRHARHRLRGEYELHGQRVPRCGRRISLALQKSHWIRLPELSPARNLTGTKT